MPIKIYFYRDSTRLVIALIRKNIELFILNKYLKVIEFNLKQSFNEATIQAVWEKGTEVYGCNSAIRRRDYCGAWIDRSEYGNTDSPNGWEIDHIRPSSKEGSDDLSNLQPLQWLNNRRKGDDYPNWTCAIGPV